MAVLLVAGLALVGTVGAFVAIRWHDGGNSSSGSGLQSRILTAYAPLTNALLAVTKADEAVLEGTGTQTLVRQALNDAGAPFADTAARVRNLKVPSRFPALIAYGGAAELYGVFRELRLVAMEMGGGQLGDQVDLMARRVKVLADRVYDRGKVALTGVSADSPGVTVVLADDVPNFAAEQLAAGPPLIAASVGPAPVEPDRASNRSTTDVASWLRAARNDGAPSATEMTAAFRTRTAIVLQDLAGRFDAAERALRAGPDPTGSGGRERNNLLRLTTMVYAEAARTDQAAALAPPAIGARLASLAARLATVGDGTWDPGLGLRYSTPA